MTNKPFEVQDDAIILNGVELQVTQQGDINVDGTPAGSDLGDFTIDGDILEADQMTIRTNDGDLFILSDSDVVIRSAAGDHEWQFSTSGNLELPEGGDIVDHLGNSVLGGGTISVGDGVGESVQQVSEILFNGTVQEIGPNVVSVNIDVGAPTIDSTVKGFINLVGDRPNENDDIWFESVVVRGNYAYVVGGDYYIDNLGHGNFSPYEPKVYKFNVNTGEQVWVKQITAGRGAEFAISVGEGLITLDSIATAGVGYIQGEEIYIQGWQLTGGSSPANDFVIVADTVGEDGEVLTASIKPGYNVDGVPNNTYTISTAVSGATSNENLSITYDDFNNKLIITAELRSGQGDVEDNNWDWTNVYVMDPTSGAINQTVTLASDSDVYSLNVRTYNKAGGVAVVGEKFNEKRSFGNLTFINGYNGYFDILKSNLDPEHYPGSIIPGDDYYNFYVTGTGITNREYVDNVNSYTQLPTTVQEGSGAQFQVVSAGDGIAYVSAMATVPNKGSNYLVGHKIKILGTALGGATPANDAIITVTEIGTGGSIEAATVSGTGGDVGGGTYNSLTGTNYQTGSGATFYTNYNFSTGITSFSIDAAGTNYVVGDILTIAGTNFANGTSPANDVEIEVTNVDGSGGVTAMQVNVDDIPTDALRITVNGVDFSGEGTWSLFQNLGGEAFLWTPTWSRAIGGAVSDRFYDVAWSADGNHLYAVGRGRYETAYDQALVVKFDASTGSIVWSKDIKFSEATSESRQARSVIAIPGSTDILVGGAWYNPDVGEDEFILTRITAAGAAVWQKSYIIGLNESAFDIDYEMTLKATDTGIVVTFDQSTNDSRGIGYLIVDPDNGNLVRHRVLSSDGNGNRVYYNDPNANYADVYSDESGDYVVIAGYTYVPTDNYYNALLIKLPLDGVKDIAVGERLSIGEHILNRHDVAVTTLTSAFEDFTATVHSDTITPILDNKGYTSRTPDGLLKVWTYKITDDTQGFLEFGDGSKQSFATNVIPQIPAANDYYLTLQDSGKHIFFEHENGTVWIPHRDVKYLPVGFTFTIVNTTGNDCWVRSESGESERARLKLAGRNISTVDVGIPDSGSGSMVTVMKIKDGYVMSNSDGQGDYPDVWIISGPGDLYDND